MGESVKKWVAGIGAALVVTVIVVIANGKIERKSTPELPAQMAAGNPQTVAQTRHSRTTINASLSPQVVVPTESPIEDESTRSAASVTASQTAPVGERKAARGMESTAGTKPTIGFTGVTAAIPNGSSDPEVAPQKPPVAPPDVATLTAMDSRPATMPVSQTEGMNVTGNVNVNGEFSKISRLVYPNDQVLTPGQNGALVTAKQNAIALGATTQFKPESMNSFLLDAGASNVSTQTGMTAKVKDWRVQPVHPEAATQYEVTYGSDGVYVYARVNDVDVINDICRRSIRVEQGKVVKIRSARGCGILWVQNEMRTWPYKVVWGSAAAAGTGVLIWIATHQERPDLSPE